MQPRSSPFHISTQFLRGHQRFVTAIFLLKQCRLAIVVRIAAKTIKCLNQNLPHSIAVEIAGLDCRHSRSKLFRLKQVAVSEFNPVCAPLIIRNIFPVYAISPAIPVIVLIHKLLIPIPVRALVQITRVTIVLKESSHSCVIVKNLCKLHALPILFHDIV